MPFGILPTRIYLGVPYKEKEDAKPLGIEWDPVRRQWWSLSNNPNLDKLLEKWSLNTEPINLIGEDRTYGGDELFIDLIPDSCWFTNVRYYVDPRDWDRLRKFIYERNENICECCGKYTKNLEAHERWDYDYDRKIQKLVRLLSLCNMCHTATHIGRAKQEHKGDIALEHLKKVRNFTHEEAIEHEKLAFQVWKKRNTITWNLDLSLLTNNGILLKKEPIAQERRNISENILLSND